MRLPIARSFRLVCAAEQIPLVELLLQAQGYEFEPEPFSPMCRRLLAEPRPLGRSLAAIFGYIYIQDRSSMLPPLALAPREGSVVLDICASPGSKTGMLAQMVGPCGLVLGNEPTPARLGTLRANLHQLNLLQTATCGYNGCELPLPHAFSNAILLDPPCSGWGTAEKNPSVLRLWTGEKIQNLVELQRRLLRHACHLLRPGGRLAYSTCTTNEAENEAQVRFAENELGLRREVLTPFPGFAWEERPGGAGTLRVDGPRSKAQGFFVAVLRKSEENAAGLVDSLAREEARPKGRFLDAQSLAGPLLNPDLLPPGRVAVFGRHVYFLPSHTDTLPAAFVWQGALLGTLVDGRMDVAPRLRALLPQPESSTALVVDEPARVMGLLSGQSWQTGLKGREAGLWWRGLPLGRVRLKNGRAVAAFR